MRQPYTVALEGIPGSGKTTLRNTVRVDGLSIDRVEQILPDNPDVDHNLGIEQIIQSDLMKTSRALSVEYDIVLLDRYYLSTLAYQWAYDNINKACTYGKLKRLYGEYLKDKKLIVPDLTFYIDTPIKESYLRKNRLPDDGIWGDYRFLELNQSYYSNQEGLYIIDGSKKLSKVRREIEDTVIKRVADK